MSKLVRNGVLIANGSTPPTNGEREPAESRLPPPSVAWPSCSVIPGSGVVERLADTIEIPPLIVLAEAIELRELRELRLSMFLAEALATSNTLGRRFRVSFSERDP
jgi:hypothetical protein